MSIKTAWLESSLELHDSFSLDYVVHWCRITRILSGALSDITCETHWPRSSLEPSTAHAPSGASPDKPFDGQRRDER